MNENQIIKKLDEISREQQEMKEGQQETMKTLAALEAQGRKNEAAIAELKDNCIATLERKIDAMDKDIKAQRKDTEMVLNWTAKYGGDEPLAKRIDGLEDKIDKQGATLDKIAERLGPH